MRAVVFTIAIVSTITNLTAGSITVDTTAAGSASYGSYMETAGPFPWSDLGFTAGASISAGGLVVSTGGSTSYSFNSTITGGETFTPGSTTLSLGYNPAWTGSFASLPSAFGDLNSQFVYNLGPFNGSQNLFNVPLIAPGAVKDLSSTLNTGSGTVSSSQSANGPGVGASLTLSAQAGLCPFCVTVASASLGFNVGSQISQTVKATPTVQYGDLIWYSTTPTYSASDPTTFVTGSGGTINDTFANPPASLGLTDGETFYMNMLPDVQLTMPVANDAHVAVPASITASWDIFGDSGSQTWPLGNLYTLSNGDETADFDGTFYGDYFYSLPLTLTDKCAPVAFCPVYQTPESTSGPNTDNGGVPGDNLPPPSLVVTGGSGTPGGYGNPNLGPLFPPANPNTGQVCGPVGTPFAGQCITQINVSPEPGGLILPGIGLLLLAGMMRRKLRP